MRLRVFYCSRCGVSHPFERLGGMFVSRTGCGKTFLARPLAIQRPLGLEFPRLRPVTGQLELDLHG